MKKISIMIILASGIINIAFSRQSTPNAKNILTLLFCNAENLFDTSYKEYWQMFDHLPVFVLMQTDKK